jgi:phosphatidylinositol alpha 1,6-mannosyltransferase
VRIVMVAETFLPQINGVANTARHVADRLRARGHELLIIAPGPGQGSYGDVPVIRARSFRTPGYKEFPVGLPDPSIERAMAEFKPDLVHLASPFIIGAYGLRSARKLGLPTVAIFQTDIAGFARQYPWFAAADRGIWRWVRRTHSRADRTLAPSTASVEALVQGGVPRVHRWGRGVNLDLFDPKHRDENWRREISPRRQADRRVRRPAGRGEEGPTARRADRPGLPDRRRRRRPGPRLAGELLARRNFSGNAPGRRPGLDLRRAGRLRAHG